MVDFSNFINSLENVKNALEEAQRKINFDEESASAEKKISSILEKSLEARNQIRNFFFECARDDEQKQKIARALKNFGNGIEDAGKVQQSFENFVSEFASQTFISLVCTEEIHEALHKMTANQQQDLIEKVDAKWPELAPRVHDNIFIFNDFKNLDDRAVQKVLREIDTETASKALVNADKEILDKIYSNMSERAAKMLQEDIEYMGPVREVDIKEERDKICQVVMRLVDYGEIAL